MRLNTMRLGSAGTALYLLLTQIGLVAQTADTIPAVGGNITVLPIAHGTVSIVHGQNVLLIDPARFVPAQPDVPRADLQELASAYLARFGAPPPPTPPGGEPLPELLVSAVPVREGQIRRFRTLPPPTLILVTHAHTDHLDPRAIAALRTPITRVILPKAAATMVLDLQGVETMANGDRTVMSEVRVDAVPMYNTAPDPQFGTVFHPRGRGNGYVLTLGGKRLYVAGDTDCTPEMMALKQIDIAFVPMNPPYTMSAARAGACVRAMKPRIVYPYHYFESDLKVFESALKGTGIEVRIRDWYVVSEASSK